MRAKAIILTLIDMVYSFFGKDPMKYRLEKYRLYGAQIGFNVRTFSPISSAESYLITIGNNVTVATNVSFITHDNSAIKLYEDGTDFVGPIVIGDNVFIGSGCIILPGVTIADNCIVGAGAVVCKSILDPGSVVGGNPARVIGTIEEMRERYVNNRFDFRSKDRRKEIMNNPNKWLRK